MWYRLGQFIVKYKKSCLAFLTLATIIMGYFAIQVKLSYEFTKAIPEDNPKFIIYKNFVKKFGVDGTTMVVGFQTDSLYNTSTFNALVKLNQSIKSIPGVTEVLSVPSAYNISKDTIQNKFVAHKIFMPPFDSAQNLKSQQAEFEQLPFYKNLLYNPSSHAYIMAISFVPDSINSGARSKIISKLNKMLI